MSRPTLDLTFIVTNKTNVTTSQLYSTPIGTKNTDPTPLKRPTESFKRKGKAHAPEDPESDPSSSDSSSSESDLYDDRKYSKSKRRRYDQMKKKRWKRTKQDS